MKGSTGLALPLPPSFTHCRRSCDFVPVGRALGVRLRGKPARRKVLDLSQAGGLPEIARLGTVVETFPAGSVEELARLMNSAVDDQVKWKANVPLQSVARDHFTDETIVGKYLSAYRSEASAGLPHTSNEDRMSEALSGEYVLVDREGR